MLKLRSIGARLILAISLTVAAACAILGTFSIMQQRALTRLALEQQLRLQYDSVIAAIDYEGRTAQAVSAAMAALPPVADAILKDDREAMMALLGQSMKALSSQGIGLMTFTRPPATIFLRIHDPKSYGEDVSARRHTIVEANNTGKPIVGVEPGRDTLANFAITPILRDGKAIAVADVGVAFGKNFVDRAKQRFGVDLAVHWFDGKAFKTFSSTFGDREVATADELKSALDGTTLQRDAVLDGHPAALYLGQIKNYAGAPIAVLEVIKEGHHGLRDRGGNFPAQPDDRHRHDPGRRDFAGVPARTRPVAPADRDHRGDEPAFQRRHRGDDPRRRPQGRTRHHGSDR